MSINGDYWLILSVPLPGLHDRQVPVVEWLKTSDEDQKIEGP